MKLAFISYLPNLHPKFSEAFKLLLFFTAFLTGAQGVALREADENTSTDTCIEKAEEAALVTCAITNITTSNLSACNNNGTNAIAEDDFFTATVTVTFTDKPATGKLILAGRGNAEVLVVNTTTATSHIFTDVQISTAAEPNQPFYLEAYFSYDPTCSFAKPSAGIAHVYCSTDAPPLCPISGSHNQNYPDCWPPEGANLPNCENSLSYAPDPDHPERTPLKYIRVVVHVLQKEDPNDPGNFTEQHIDVIKSFFDGPGGVNDFLGNLCPSPDDYSPDISDSRIRLLNTGTIGNDVFFHRNNRGWGTSFYEAAACPGETCSPNVIIVNGQNQANCFPDGQPWQQPPIPPDTDCCYKDLSLGAMRDLYVTGGNNGSGWSPDLPQSQIAALSSDDIRNAYHIFMSGGRWRDCNGNNIPDPQGIDSYQLAKGAFTSSSSLNCVGNAPPTTPMALYYGLYNAYQANPSQAAKLGTGLVGELYHVMGVDHIGPLRAHFRHLNGDDGCDDTPWGVAQGHGTSTNVLSCDFLEAPGTKCALTQCQLGKIHYFFEKLNPAIQRFPDGAGPHIPVGNGNYNMVGNCDINLPDIIINSGEHEVWDIDIQLRSNVVVKSGGSLTITCRVGMPNSGKMTVEKGGKLTVDGGEVYNNCAPGWKGFVVEGDPTADWSVQAQGYLRLTNAALVQGAYMSEIMGGGRILSTDESTFYNCGNLTLYPYFKTSKSWFFDTNFTYDGETATTPIANLTHVSLAGNRGTMFSNCDFSAMKIPHGMLEQTYGISATGSVFTVSNGSTFSGFFNGIFAHAWMFSPLSNFSVGGNCVFSDNKIGINAFGTNNISVTRNVFNVGGGAYGTDIGARGIVMTNCTGYNVERNTLSGTGNVPTERIGILVDNSGSAFNRIKDNILSSLSRGNQAQLVNSGALSGLQYLCNQNSNNTRDFLAIGPIFPKQGNGNAARNTFTQLYPPDGDFRNEAGTIKYYHSTTANQVPLYVFGVDKVIAQKNNACSGDPDNDETKLTCTLTPTEWQETETKFYDSKSAWQSDATSLTALLDGGNTSALLSQVNGASLSNATQVVQQLQANSPYLTEEVLKAAIGKVQVLSSNAVRDILIANPDELGKSAVRVAVHASFPATTAATILSHSNDATARTEKEIKVAEYRIGMQLAADKLICHIEQDTLGLNLPLLRTWLGNKQSIEADYSIVSSYISEGNFTAAYQKLSDITQDYALDAQQTQSHGNFVTLVGTWKNIQDNQIPVNAIPASTIASIKAIADTEPGMAGAMSRGVLNAFYGYHYEVIALDPSGQLQPLVMPDMGSGTANLANGHYITAYPNPASKSVAFNWQLPSNVDKGIVQIMDMQGREVERMAVDGQFGSINWETDKVDAGFYFFKIKFVNGESDMAKLVIIK